MILRSFALMALLGPAAYCSPVLAQAPASQTPPPAPATTQSAPAAASQDLPDAPSTVSHAKAPPVPTGPTVVIDSTMGRMTCKLFDKIAPVASANFIGLAEGSKDWEDQTTHKKVHHQPFYNGVTFHRVIPGFMIQGGDRLGTGMGDAGYYFDNETDPSLTFDVAGRLAMANAGQGTDGHGTNGSQFFITEVPYPDLNGGYTIFGQCDEHSVLVVASIARVDRDAQDKPREPVIINKVTIVREGQPMPPLPAAAPAATPKLPAATSN
ncbi:peptidylprolyl isomerase [Granulicella aggregans]|jgi:peptidyl-prolyl cis-trans isomerase A (cyclophilin A)|uniref:peptidylprolyl isomerase n=1 Tax=Granulicella aggregans TaxID=474949 RepID=UPI0021DFDE47|nr:peptidylprolyl isomerase [Granulicella aggregans]